MGESDPIQLVRLHPSCLWYELHRDAPDPAPRKLPDPPDLLLRSLVQRGGAAPRVQALPSGTEEPVRFHELVKRMRESTAARPQEGPPLGVAEVHPITLLAADSLCMAFSKYLSIQQH